MKSKGLIWIMAGVLLLCLFVSGVSALTCATRPGVCNTDTGTNYETIQLAINTATTWDTITVDSGFYKGFTVNKPSLTIRGIDYLGGGLPVVNGDPGSYDLMGHIKIQSDGTTVENFKLVPSANDKTYGVRMTSSHNTLKNIEANNFYYGIYIGDYGTEIGDQSYNKIMHSSGSGNTIGIYLNGGANTVDNWIVDSCTLTGGIEGILLRGDNNLVEDIALSGMSQFGLLVEGQGNIIHNNTLTNMPSNSRAISLEGAGNTIDSNTFTNNYLGIVAYPSGKNNLIYNNIFQDSPNSHSGVTNNWNTALTEGTNIIGGSYLGGNYWANTGGTGFSQTCTNAGDGICTLPYRLDSNNVDNYPLTGNPVPPPPAPLVTDIEPATGVNTGSVPVTITGANFAEDATVMLTPKYANPVHAGAIAITRPMSVFVSGNYAYVVSSDGSSTHELRIVDISNPAEPQDEGAVELGYGPKCVYVAGNYAYVASSTSQVLEIIDITNPTDPLYEGNVDLAHQPERVYVTGGYAYLVGSFDDSLEIVDVSDPTNPERKGSILDGEGYAPYLYGAVGVSVAGNYAYVASMYSDALEVIDVSDPDNPAHAGYLHDGGGVAPFLDGAINVFVQGHYAYVSSYDSDALEIVDISDPANPLHAGSIRDDHPNIHYLNQPVGCYVQGSYAYVASYLSDHLEIVDVGTITGTVTSSSTTQIGCTFDLNGKPIGSYNVVVTNPDGEFGTLGVEYLEEYGFTVLPPMGQFGCGNVVFDAAPVALRGTWHLDFDTGRIGYPVDDDVWWEIIDDTERQLVPQNGAAIVALGSAVDFDSITIGDLTSYTYSSTPINGNVGDPENQLLPGAVFAVHTNSGNYNKVEVLNYGWTLSLHVVTYSNPATPACWDETFGEFVKQLPEPPKPEASVSISVNPFRRNTNLYEWGLVGENRYTTSPNEDTYVLVYYKDIGSNLESLPGDITYYFVRRTPPHEILGEPYYASTPPKDLVIQYVGGKRPPAAGTNDVGSGSGTYSAYCPVTSSTCSDTQIDCKNCYALLISGGYDKDNNNIRYWNEISCMYKTLRQKYCYPENQIYVLMSDGPNNPEADRYTGIAATPYDNSPMELDGKGGTNDIYGAATYADLVRAISDLKSKNLGTADHLFIYTTNHGGKDPAGTGHVRLWLWGGEFIWDSDFAQLLEGLNAGAITMTMEQCYSGGFVNDFIPDDYSKTQVRVIATAASDSEPSYGNDFSGWWINGTAGYANINADKLISLSEDFLYANQNDPSRAAGRETPQYRGGALNPPKDDGVTLGLSSCSKCPAPKILPNCPDCLIPLDTIVDGIFEDVNGHDGFTLGDVILYFTYMDSISTDEPICAFDTNANNRIDFADVVNLYGKVPPS